MKTKRRRRLVKFHISKEWFLKRAHLEEGLEIGAGSPNRELKAALALAEDYRRQIPTTTQAMAYQNLLEKYNAAQARCAELEKYFAEMARGIRVIAALEEYEAKLAEKGRSNEGKLMDLIVKVAQQSNGLDPAVNLIRQWLAENS